MNQLPEPFNSWETTDDKLENILGKIILHDYQAERNFIYQLIQTYYCFLRFIDVKI